MKFNCPYLRFPTVRNVKIFKGFISTYNSVIVVQCEYLIVSSLAESAESRVGNSDRQ